MSYRHLSHRQKLSECVPQSGVRAPDFTNVTEMSWPDVAVHPRFADKTDPVRLRAALQLALSECSYEALARLSWVVASTAP